MRQTPPRFMGRQFRFAEGSCRHTNGVRADHFAAADIVGSVADYKQAGRTSFKPMKDLLQSPGCYVIPIGGMFAEGAVLKIKKNFQTKLAHFHFGAFSAIASQ